MVFNDRIPVSPDKCIRILGIDGYETYRIDENTISVRPKWIKIPETVSLPENFEEVLFTDSHEVFKGYRFKPDVEHPDMWFCGEETIHGVTHWMSLPKPPKEQQ